MIRAVFFDFYDTLVEWVPTGEAIQAAASAEEGVVVSKEAVARAYSTANAFMTHKNARQPIVRRSEAQRQAFFAAYEQRLLEAAGATVDEDTALRVWHRVNAAPKQLGLFEDAGPALEEVADAGLKTGVISNMGRDLGDLIEGLGIRELVDVVASSGEVGTSKPHPGIFQAAMAMAGVGPQEALHVGDDYDGDYQGARGAHMHALLLVRNGRAEAPEACPAVSTLRGVLPYLRHGGFFE